MSQNLAPQCKKKTDLCLPYLSLLASLGDSNDDDGDHHGDGERFGKNSIYHLLNKKFNKYVKGLVNKNWVKEIVNPVLPSQTPTSIPWCFRWHIIVSVP